MYLNLKKFQIFPENNVKHNFWFYYKTIRNKYIDSSLGLHMRHLQGLYCFIAACIINSSHDTEPLVPVESGGVPYVLIDGQQHVRYRPIPA